MRLFLSTSDSLAPTTSLTDSGLDLLKQTVEGSMVGKLRVKSVSSTVFRESHGDYFPTEFGIKNLEINQLFDNINDAASWLIDLFNLSETFDDFLFDEESGYLTTDLLVVDKTNQTNKGIERASNEEIAKWREGEIEILRESFSFKIENL